MVHMSQWGLLWGLSTLLPTLCPSLSHHRLPLELGNLLVSVETLKPLHSFRLVLLRRVRLTQYHLDSGVSKHRGQCHEVNTRHGGSRSPCVAKVIQSKAINLAGLHSPVMRVIHLWDGSSWVSLTREEVGAF